MSEIYSGFFVGITQTIIGHPLDTLKVLYQNKTPINNIKLSNLYRGWKFPMFSASIFSCTVYTAYERSYKYTNNHFISGAIAGVAVTPSIYLLDIGKIKQQVNSPLKITDYYKTKGFTMTSCREILAMSVYFGSYNKSKNMGLDPLVAGGIAGLTNWTLTYPLDVIKTRQMARNISIRQAFKEKQLWRGYSVCAIRAIIVNAANFKVYETVKPIFDSIIKIN